MTREARRAQGLATLLVVLLLPLAALAFWILGPSEANAEREADTDHQTDAAGENHSPKTDSSGETLTMPAGLSGDPEPPPEATPPEDQRLRLSVPKMARVDDIPVTTAETDDNSALDNGALHARGTGFPWQNGANVYIAGHRIGYPTTDSYLLFLDLNKLSNGDRIVLYDAEDTTYEYRVYESFRVSPSKVSVMEPLRTGESVVSLQTCTLPDYKERLIVRARLVESDTEVSTT